MAHREEPIFLVAGDLLPSVQGTLEDFDGEPLSLAAASLVQFLVQPSGYPSTIFTASCAFSTADTGASVGHVTHSWSASTVATAPNFYQAQFRITDNAGRTRTVPNPGYHPLTVATRM